MDNVTITFNAEAEREVIGAMMVRNGEKIPAVLNILTADDFYFSEHSEIFNRVVGLYVRGIKPNLTSLVEEMMKTVKDKEKIIYAVEVLNSTYTNAYIEHHARIVKEKSELRKLTCLAKKFLDDTQKGVKPVAEIISGVSNEFSNFSTVDGISKFTASRDFFTNNFKNRIEEMKKFALRKTGFSNIDEQQIFSSGLYLIGGTPAAGKTTFAWQWAEQLSQRGEVCIFCSYEMSELELFTKSVARELFRSDPSTKLTAAEIRKGGWSNEVDTIVEARQKDTSDLRVLELQDETVDDLLKLLKPICTGKDKVTVFIDYLQIIPSSKEGIKNGIDDTVRKLKVFQRATNTTFVVISSFNRNNYSQSVAFESFKESGGIEYSADVVFGLQLYAMNQIKCGSDVSTARKKIEEAKKQKPRQIQLKCLKNRQGNTYDCYFKYFSAHDCFEPCEEKDFEENINSNTNFRI